MSVQGNTRSRPYKRSTERASAAGLAVFGVLTATAGVVNAIVFRESFADRSVLGGLMLGFTCGGVLAGTGIVGWRKLSPENAALLELPQAKWTWSPDDRWQGRMIQQDRLHEFPSRYDFGGLMLLALALALTPFLVVDLLHGRRPRAWVFWPLAIVALIPGTLGRMRIRKFGMAELAFEGDAPRIGRQIALSLRIPLRATTVSAFHTQLECLRRRITYSDGGVSDTDDQTMWEHRETIAASAARLDGEATVLPVLLHFPREQPPTDGSNWRDQIVWRYSVSARAPGLGFKASFEIPVHPAVSP